MNGHELTCEAKALVKEYSLGLNSAEHTAYTLWQQKLTLPSEPNPHAGDVILWSRQLGYGIPDVSAEEAKAVAEKAIKFFKG